MTEVETYEPVITRKNISIYELAALVTKLSLHIYNMKDLDKYIDELEINNIIDPVEVAWNLLKNGKINAVFERESTEKVTFSNLDINEDYIDMIEDYIKQQKAIKQDTFVKRLGLT